MIDINSLPKAMPTLKGDDAKEFLQRINENKDKPLFLKPVPKIEQAREIARQKLK